MQNWNTLQREVVWRSGDGTFLIVENHTVELPDGHVIEEWPWLITPDYVNVVAETKTGDFICFRQTKYAAGGITLAIPGGYLEVGEEPLQAARRELLEETGYAAPEWIALGRYVVDGNRGSGFANLFLARGAEWVQPVDADDLEEQQILLLNRREIEQALVGGEFRVLPWATSVALALMRIDQRNL